MGQQIAIRKPVKTFQVALVVRNECVRRGLTVMLRSLRAVHDVRVWNHISPVAPVPPDDGFDILVLRFGDLPSSALASLAADAWHRGKKVLILLDREHDKMIDVVTSIPSNGFLVQDDLTSASLSAAIDRVTLGDTPMPPVLANHLLARARQDTWDRPLTGRNLTPRERQVLVLLVKGLSNQQIARQLLISRHGVKRLVSNILAKLNCPNRTQAVAVALTDGLVSAEVQEAQGNVWTPVS
ncbi:hypothetical protein GCM10009546_06510 [Actinomadura livida]|uniref:HTH luxR-type domain-containing protein n=1 Tax=Actinomadura livida TaxID=79909 RepID=A0ABP3NKT7_9ACTN|nr:DNA-binding response regulator [Actinomadura livida]